MSSRPAEIEVSLREFDGEIVSAYSDLFPGDVDTSLDFLEWRFKANPHGPGRFAIARSDGRIVGMIALLPTLLIGRLGTRRGYQAIDTVVHPSQQGRGLFVRMGRCAEEQLDGDVLWGFPNANAAPGWYRRLGWTNFGAVPLLMRPLRSSFLLGRVHPKLRSIDFPLVGSRRCVGSVYSDRAALSADFDALWQSVAPDFGIVVDRGGDWAGWRLWDKPDADYRCAGLKDGSGALQAFVATKIADKHGARLLYIMDAIAEAARTDDLAQLLLEELAIAARKGAEAALAWCSPNSPSYGAYRKSGFLPVPLRMRPIEINFGARSLTPEGASAVAPDARWSVSFLDSDTN